MSSHGSKIPNFICSYFQFITEVVRILNKDGESHISREIIELLAQKDNVPLDNMVKLKIARVLDEDMFEIDRRVVDFVAFSNNEFALSSPASVRKFHYSLSELYDDLLRANNANDIIKYGDYLIAELRGFSDALDTSVSRLLKETLDLKENIQNMSNMERLDYAGKIIKDYVEPLGEIVADREDTILPLVRKISLLAIQKGSTFDYNIENKMRNLKVQADTTHEYTELFGKMILSELFTLRKIRRTNSILAGAIGWLEHQERLMPKGVCNAMRVRVHAKEFFFDVIDEIEKILSKEEKIFIPSPEKVEAEKPHKYFHFNQSKYLKRIEENLPVDHIYQWIYEELDKKGELTYENYCYMLSLLDQLSVHYSNNRDRLKFESFCANVPIAVVDSILTREGGI